MNGLIIRRSYHGIGGREGYRYRVLGVDMQSLGWIHDFPLNHEGEVFKIGDKFYESMYEEDDNTPNGEKYEVSYVYLKEYEPIIKYFDVPVSSTRKNTETLKGNILNLGGN